MSSELASASLRAGLDALQLVDKGGLIKQDETGRRDAAGGPFCRGEKMKAAGPLKNDLPHRILAEFGAPVAQGAGLALNPGR